MRVLSYGIIEGIFLASKVDVEGTIARVLNNMFDTLYSMITPERQGIFPIFWIKFMVWLSIVALPWVGTLIEVHRLERTGWYLFILGIVIGFAMVVLV